MPDGEELPDDAYAQARALPRDHRRRAGEGRRAPGRRRAHSHLPDRAATRSRVSRAHTRRCSATIRPASTARRRPSCSTNAGSSRSRRRRSIAVKQIYPDTITGKGFAPGGSVLDHKFGQSDPYTLGVEEEYMLLDGETFDLVQHIDTVLAAVSGHELGDRITPELMQSVLEIATPVCRSPAEVDQELRKLRGYVVDVAREKRPPRRLGRHAPVLALRAPADHRARPLPEPRRPAPVRRPPRADLRHARPRRRRRRREGDPDRERHARRAADAARAVGELTVLAWRADRALLLAADGLRGVPPLGAAAALPRLRGLRRGRRAAREDRLHRRLHAHLVGHPAPSQVGHGRGPHLRRGHARRGRRRDHGVLPGARQVLLGAVRRRQADPVVPPHPDDREQVARRALRARGADHGSRRRDGGTASPSRS